MNLIPLPETVKVKLDVAMVPGAISMPWLASFDWASMAAFLAALYGVLRLLEWGITRLIRVAKWVQHRRSAPSASQDVDE